MHLILLNLHVYHPCSSPGMQFSCYPQLALWPERMEERKYARYGALVDCFICLLSLNLPVMICLVFQCCYQSDVEEVHALYLDAKSSARLLQEQQERYISWNFCAIYCQPPPPLPAALIHELLFESELLFFWALGLLIFIVGTTMCNGD